MTFEEFKKNPEKFRPWQTSTWPEVSNEYVPDFKQVLERIFCESILAEIRNVINDAKSLEGRGHVIVLSILCAIDALSSYAFRDCGTDKCPECERPDKAGPRYGKYISTFFPNTYRPFAKRLYKNYRTFSVHSWNLFGATITPGNEEIREEGQIIVIGLKKFFADLETSVKNFLEALPKDVSLQTAALCRYKQLKSTDRPIPAHHEGSYGHAITGTVAAHDASNAVLEEWTFLLTKQTKILMGRTRSSSPPTISSSSRTSCGALP